MPTPNPPYSFLGLLVSLLFFLTLPGIFNSHTGSVIPFAFILLLVASLYLVATEKKFLIIGLALAIPVLLTYWSLGIVTEVIRLNINSMLYIFFLCYICSQIFNYLTHVKKIEKNVIYAALCLYLLLGIIWAFAYFLLEINIPGAISINTETLSTSSNNRELIAEMIYFSFVTFTTLGYGDVTPASHLAQSLTIIQALLGQVYIAIVIARLVAMQIAQQLSKS